MLVLLLLFHCIGCSCIDVTLFWLLSTLLVCLLTFCCRCLLLWAVASVDVAVLVVSAVVCAVNAVSVCRVLVLPLVASWYLVECQLLVMFVAVGFGFLPFGCLRNMSVFLFRLGFPPVFGWWLLCCLLWLFLLFCCLLVAVFCSEVSVVGSVLGFFCLHVLVFLDSYVDGVSFLMLSWFFFFLLFLLIWDSFFVLFLFFLFLVLFFGLSDFGYGLFLF
mgnify:FL=1